MDNLDTGVPTLHTRVESWECDFNGHWNTRYYSRAFQAAAEVAAALANNVGSDIVTVSMRHMRFHGELHSGDAVEIRSFDIADACAAPLTGHFMLSDGKVAATSLDYGFGKNSQLRSLSSAVAHCAMPRGLTGAMLEPWQPNPDRDHIVELGPVRATELHHDGTLQFEIGVAKLAVATQHHIARLGYSHEFTRQTSIGRMLVELRYRRLGTCGAGACLRAVSRLLSVKAKSYVTAHVLYSHSGRPAAMFELCTLAVDLATRRAIDVPDLLMSAIR